MSRYDLLKITAKHVGLGIADTFSAGMGSAVKNSIAEIKEYAQKNNEALYYLQVKTFLETEEFDQEEIDKFFNENPENLRLGVEIFKILEQTFLEKQAEYLARGFKKYVQKKIKSQKLYEYIHVIEQLNRHVLDQIQKDLNAVSKYSMHGLPRAGETLSTMAFTSNNTSKNQVLQTIGFIDEEPDQTPVTLSGSIKPKVIYKRTKLYLDFFQDIIEEEQCTE
ncbi:hypothetical protein M5F00_11105 [Acinetobacter sp. ANC 4945]|uniref:Uncharacterized protein n=1 Tax=Acinetobacter amyesii TaxID=2942470 RepID=A0A1T1GQB9_9GAMM|nr:hypothetical protein [Acinetobacter amyesii]MCL6248406.1 hypothetical protein [Acinetobacter amyesii]OOV79647.1 hypothetical protein B1202_15955 [Acinetobacter amyesii]